MAIQLPQHEIDRLKLVANKRVAELQFMAIEKFGDSARGCVPLIDMSLRGTCAGQALGNQKIRVNAVLMHENFDDYVKNTIGHEYAHCIDYHMNGYSSNHGARWKNIMRMLGLDPSRCHSYDTTNARVRTKKRYTYVCACREYQLTSVRHNKVVRGQATYHCRFCKTTLKLDNGKMFAVAQTQTPKKPTKRTSGGTKMEAAVAIFKSKGDTMSRQEIIGLFVSELGMSKAGASTYYYNVKKKLGL